MCFSEIERRKKVKKYYKLNIQISAPRVRLVDAQGKQVGIVDLKEALEKAQKEGLDLVEIAAQANPPVAKIIDFKKFKYLEQKKEKEARRHTKQTELKEVRFSPFIGEHDFNTGIEKIRRFISQGDLVKITIQFKGRQMAHQEFGPRLVEKILATVQDIAEKERDGTFQGRRLSALLRPKKSAVKETKKQNGQTKEQKSSS